MHKILERQIKRLVPDTSLLEEEHIKKLLATISETYEHVDRDRTLLERSLDISSKELSEANEQLRHEVMNAKNSKAENKELERMNKFMIGRELEMVELKKKVTALEKKLSEMQSS